MTGCYSLFVGTEIESRRVLRDFIGVGYLFNWRRNENSSTKYQCYGKRR
jgi:hypothetical protein